MMVAYLHEETEENHDNLWIDVEDVSVKLAVVVSGPYSLIRNLNTDLMNLLTMWASSEMAETWTKTKAIH
jgi:hypothetical protein